MNAHSIINGLFFGVHKIQKASDLLRLQPYFLHNEKMPFTPFNPLNNPPFLNDTAIIKEPIESNVTLVEIEPVKNDIKEKVEKTNWFDPKQKDTLFWCIFTAVYGESEYLMVGSKYANRELEEKSKMIAEFKKSSVELRSTNHKMTLGSIQEMMSEYMTNQADTTFLGLVGSAVYYKLRITLVDDSKKTYINVIPTNFVKSCILYKNNHIKGYTKYRLFMDDTDERLETLKKEYFCLEGYSKPLRAISSYKRQELDDIATRFGLDNKMKKEEVYNRIMETIVWR
jgi:hypothetical protein